MSDDFEKVKKEVTIGQVIEHFGGKVVKKFAKPCPGCGGSDCCSVGEDEGVCNCFSCDLGGSVIDVAMKVQGYDKVDAMKYLADQFNIDISDSGSVKQKRERLESGLEKALRIAMGHYKGVRENGGSDKAMKLFLKDRGHFDETMETMQVGLTDGGLCKALKKEGFTIAEIVNHGLAVDKDGKTGEPLKQPRDFFWKKNMLVFPVIDHAGKVISLTVKDPEKKFTAQQMKGIKKDWFINYAALGKHSELFIVEGQHDVGSLFDIGFKNASGTCGGPGNDQVKKIKNFCAGKRVYLWFDKDPDKDPKKSQGGPAHTRFIYNGLKESSVDVRIIMHPGEMKDPDDFIQGILKDKNKAEAKKVVKGLMEEALSPLEWEIEQLKLIKNDKDRFAVMRQRDIPTRINSSTSLVDREGYIDLLACVMNRTVKAIESLLENEQDLYHEIKGICNDNIKSGDPYTVGDHIYKWFENNAGKFFKTSDRKGWLFYHGTTFEIGNNNPFNALMMRLTRLLYTDKPGGSVWYVLATLCELRGEPVEMMSWIYTDRKSETIYCNLTLPHQKIIQIAPGQDPAVIDNGTNANGVLLNTSPQIREFVYNTTPSEAEGFRALKRHLMDNTPCDRPQQYFLACWTISLFMVNFQSDRGLMQIIGTSGLGKSKVAERVSQLVYGDNFLGDATGAADTRIATQNPVVFLDNLENCDLSKKKVKFLLLLANAANSPMAEKGSDTGVVYQKLNSMGMITAIAPFPGRLPELINRTFPLILDGRYRKKGYMHDEVMREILRDRSIMLSSIFKMIGTAVLPNLGTRTFWSEYIQSKFAGHNKERNNEHICTMMIILEALLTYIPLEKEKDVREQALIMLDDWIRYQEEQAAQTQIESNTLVTFMNGMMKEVLIRMKGRKINFESHKHFKDVDVKTYMDEVFMHEFYLTDETEMMDPGDEKTYMKARHRRFEFIASSAEMLIIFDEFCKGKRKNPFDNPTELGSRIGNDLSLLAKAGWKPIQHETSEDIQPRWTKRNGTYIWRWSFSIRAGNVPD